MADYDVIRQQIYNINLELENLQMDNTDKRSFRERTLKLLSELDQKEIEEIKQAKESKLREAEAENLRPIEDAISQTDKDVQALKEKFAQKKEELSANGFLEEYAKEFEMLDEVSKLNGEVEELASEILGKEMADDILNNLDNYEIDMNTDTLEEYMKKHSKILKTLKLMKKDINFNFYMKVDKFLQVLNPCKDDANMDTTKVRNSIIVYMIICGTISFCTLYYASSWLFVGCLAIGAFNLKKSSTLEQSLIDSKILCDNIDKMREKINAYATEDSDAAIAKLTEDFDGILATLERRRSNYEAELERMLQETRDTFSFDDSMIKKSYLLSKKAKEKEISDIDKGLSDNIGKSRELKAKLNNLNQDLQMALKEVRNKYIALNGTNNFFDTRYVLDVTDNEIVEWEHPKSSALFLYDGGVSYTDTFIRLFIAETLSKFSCCSCMIDVWDTITLASSYRIFTKNMDDPSDKSRGCVSVMINEDEVEESLSSLESELAKRALSIKQETDNIDEFNELMVKVEGTCLDYRFLILDNFDLTMLGNSRLMRLITSGSEMGIYIMIFCRLDDFLELGDVAVKLLRNIGRVFRLGDENIQGLATNKLLERLENDN